MLMLKTPTMDFRDWMKCIFSVLVFKKRDPSFTYEVIVVDDGSKDQTTKVRKRSVFPRNQRYGFLHCSCGIMFCLYILLLEILDNANSSF